MNLYYSSLQTGLYVSCFSFLFNYQTDPSTVYISIHLFLLNLTFMNIGIHRQVCNLIFAFNLLLQLGMHMHPSTCQI